MAAPRSDPRGPTSLPPPAHRTAGEDANAFPWGRNRGPLRHPDSHSRRGGSRDANSAPVGGVGGRGESPRAAAPGKAHAHWLRCQGCLAPIGCRAEKSVCHECALDGLPSGAAGLTCRGLSRARTGVPGWLAAAGSGCRSCARGKDTHGWKVPATLAFGPGYPLCIRDLGARHPPAGGTVALVMDGKGSGCRAPPFFFFFKPLGSLVVGKWPFFLSISLCSFI